MLAIKKYTEIITKESQWVAEIVTAMQIRNVGRALWDALVLFIHR